MKRREELEVVFVGFELDKAFFLQFRLRGCQSGCPAKKGETDTWAAIFIVMNDPHNYPLPQVEETVAQIGGMGG